MSGKDKIPAYREYSIPFVANEVVEFAAVGDVLAFLDVNGAFDVSIDETEASDVRASVTFEMPEGERFQKLRFRETAGATGNIKFLVARGTVRDNRSSVSGDLSVQNAAAPADELQVTTKVGSLVQSRDQQLYDLLAAGSPAAVTSLDGASYSENTTNEAAPVTLVTAAANVSGISILLYEWYYQHASHASFLAHDNAAGTDLKYLSGTTGALTGANVYKEGQLRDVFIPARRSLVVQAVDTRYTKRILWYKVL